MLLSIKKLLIWVELETSVCHSNVFLYLDALEE